jgi:hypothetical protein
MSILASAISSRQIKTFSRPAVAAIILFTVYLLSLPPKWATLHLSGLLLVFTILLARRDDWRGPAMRNYILVTCSWLVPVALAALWQNLIGLETATTSPELLRLVLRMLMIGMGMVVLLQRNWLTLRGATVVMLCVLAVNVIAGYVEWMQADIGMQEGWRAFRMQGMVFNPNPFGTLMALAIVLSAGLLRTRSHNVLLWALLVLAIPAVWASGSRGAILVMLVGLTVLFLPRNRISLIIYMAGALLMMLALVMYAFSDHKYSHGDVLRAEAATFSIEMVLEAPWHGWGKEAFSKLPGKPDVNAPHNLLLDLAVTSGLVAVLGWLWSLSWLSMVLVRKNGEAARVVLAMLAAIVVAGILEYSLLNSTHFRGLWVLVTVFACWVLALPDADERAGCNPVLEARHG